MYLFRRGPGCQVPICGSLHKDCIMAAITAALPPDRYLYGSLCARVRDGIIVKPRAPHARSDRKRCKQSSTVQLDYTAEHSTSIRTYVRTRTGFDRSISLSSSSIDESYFYQHFLSCFMVNYAQHARLNSKV